MSVWKRFRFLWLTGISSSSLRGHSLARGFTASAIFSHLVRPALAQQHITAMSSTVTTTTGETSHTASSSLGLGDQSWRSLIEVSMARSRTIRGSNYVQLATVDPTTLEPRCRTVVFRGFQTVPDRHPASEDLHCGTERLSTVVKLCTDARSQKVQQLNKDGAVGEIVWWFPKSNEQYRIRGTLLLVGSPLEDDDVWRHARKELWGNLTDAARESFLDSNKVPGQPIAASPAECPSPIPAGGRDPVTGKPLPPPDSFLLLLLFPHHVDYLNLQENYRQIDTLEATPNGKKEWSFQTVNA